MSRLSSFVFNFTPVDVLIFMSYPDSCSVKKYLACFVLNLHYFEQSDWCTTYVMYTLMYVQCHYYWVPTSHWIVAIIAFVRFRCKWLKTLHTFIYSNTVCVLRVYWWHYQFCYWLAWKVIYWSVCVWPVGAQCSTPNAFLFWVFSVAIKADLLHSVCLVTLV